jgi:hypothetical protein
MIANLSFRIECPSPQKAAALRDKLGAVLAEDSGVTVIATAAARETEPYEVLAVLVATEEVVTEVVEASSEEEARGKAEAVGKVIAEVRRGTA